MGLKNNKVKELINYWCQKYFRIIGFPYVVVWSKHGNIVKNFLSQINNDVKFAKEIVDYIFMLEYDYFDLSQLLNININVIIQEMVREREIQKRVRKAAEEIKKQIKENN